MMWVSIISKTTIRYKKRLILATINISMMFWLALIVLILGTNINMCLDEWLQKYSFYCFIFCYPNNEGQRQCNISNSTSVKAITAVKVVETDTITINGNTISVPVYEFSSNYGNNILSELTLWNNSVIPNSEDEALISASMAQYLGILDNYYETDIIFSDGSASVIMGVFEDGNYAFPISVIKAKNEITSPDFYLACVDSFESINAAELEIRNAGFTTESYSYEIEEMLGYVRMIKTGTLIISASILLLSIVMLAYTLIEISKDLGPFLIMLKAIGYKKTHYFVFFASNSLLSIIISFGISYILTLVFSWSLPHFLHLFEITELFGNNIEVFSIINCWKYIIMSFLFVAVCAFIMCEIVSSLVNKKGLSKIGLF